MKNDIVLLFFVQRIDWFCTFYHILPNALREFVVKYYSK
jgi:hypothetical protein